MSMAIGFDRRELMQRMLLLAGATAIPVGSDVFAATPRKGKRMLSAPHFALLSAVADTIVPRTDTPGANDAGVPAKFDAMLRDWASPARRTELIGALDAIDLMARKSDKKRFAALTPARRNELLTVHDAAALKNVPRKDKLTGMMAMMAGPAVADPGYAKMRELILLLYYYSEAALTSELTYEHSPGDWTPSIKVTPETRAPGGLGMF